MLEGLGGGSAPRRGQEARRPRYGAPIVGSALVGSRQFREPRAGAGRRPLRRAWAALGRLGAGLAKAVAAPLGSLRTLARRIGALDRGRRALLASAALLALSGLSFGISALLRGPAFPLPRGAFLRADDGVQDLLLEFASPELGGGGPSDDSGAANLPPLPVTLEMQSYTVRPGDSLASIAKRFGRAIDTIISANGISSAQSVRSGAQLRIPNIDGVIYRVKSGDSLATVAKRFKADTTRIVDANDLGSARIAVGQSLIIPGARLPAETVKQALGQRVIWPVRGPISSTFGYRPDPFTGVRRFHGGVDIVVDMGTPVKAAIDGKVSDVGYNANYGNYIILTHADGFQSLYGHLESIGVSEGAQVAQGSVIGHSGNTGYSTGPHLHFSLFKRGLALNPLKYLK